MSFVHLRLLAFDKNDKDRLYMIYIHWPMSRSILHSFGIPNRFDGHLLSEEEKVPESCSESISGHFQDVLDSPSSTDFGSHLLCIDKVLKIAITLKRKGREFQNLV